MKQLWVGNLPLREVPMQEGMGVEQSAKQLGD